MEPGGPFVGDEFILKPVVLGHVRQEALHLRGHVVLDEPELHPRPAHEAPFCVRAGGASHGHVQQLGFHDAEHPS